MIADIDEAEGNNILFSDILNEQWCGSKWRVFLVAKLDLHLVRYVYRQFQAKNKWAL